MTTTAERMRAWEGPAIFSFGFRPFFLMAGIWAAAAMVLWIAMLSGWDGPPTAFDPIAWHAHEFLFGFLSAVMAGFLLTAVPNWTGRLPITGWPLVGLALLWLAGRAAVAVSAHLPALVVAAVDLGFLVVLAGVLAREIVAGRNWRNLPVLGLLGVFTLGNALFHWEAAQGGAAAQGLGLRLALGAAVMLIGLIGGRIVPSFTRNWLVQRGETRLPAPPMQRLDKAALLVLGAALLLWVAAPDHALTGAALLIAGALHLARLARWRGALTLAEPLVTVLHAGYLFVPLGALGLGAEILSPGTFGMAAAQHLWMAGAIGLMTLAVMTRAALGHGGRPLHATAPIAALYVLLVVSVIARLLAGALPGEDWPLHLSATAWIAAWGGFAVIYWPILTRPKAAAKRPSGGKA
ncbi:NnrS family protein [Gemmobacter nectariphilus]|uniref:NnrS family protein n=1 Tax=Gemmobacter nectariphilus TaxID=220343 RepID=UPI0004101A1C|nr:NnrS family protein [Gemmobacter nectariphilus]